jgi:hypothetical protein
MLPGARGENDSDYQHYLASVQSKKQVKNKRKTDGSRTALLIVLYILLLILIGDFLASIIGAVTGHLPYNSIGFAVLRMAIFGSLVIWGIVSVSKRSNKEIIKCPICESDTVLRTAKKGPDAGKKFYVCKHYPECKGRVQA